MVLNTYLKERIDEVDNTSPYVARAYGEWLMNRIIGAYDNISCVLLFGSRARGTATDASDFDILIIADPCDKDGSHDLLIDDGLRLDVHVVSSAGLSCCLKRERVVRASFFTQAISEGVIVHGGNRLTRLQQEVREVYVQPGPFSRWPKLKINLVSKLRQKDKSVPSLGRNIYYGELAQFLIQILALQKIGWLSRPCATVDMLNDIAPCDIGKILEYHEFAIAGDPGKLFDACRVAVSDLCGEIDDNRSFSVSHDGVVSMH